MSDLQEKIALIISSSPTPSAHSKKKAQAAIDTICEALMSEEIGMHVADVIFNILTTNKLFNVSAFDIQKAALTAAAQKLRGIT